MNAKLMIKLVILFVDMMKSEVRTIRLKLESVKERDEEEDSQTDDKKNTNSPVKDPEYLPQLKSTAPDSHSSIDEDDMKTNSPKKIVVPTLAPIHSESNILSQ